MAQQTGIEWTEATWNPIVGCSVISPACKRCYAMKMAARLALMGNADHYRGTTQMTTAGAVWTGKIAAAPDRIWLEPLHRKKPTVYFVNSMGDLFHEAVPDAWIDRAFAIMALAPRHTFQVLTKRSKRMRDYVTAALPSVWHAAVQLDCEKHIATDEVGSFLLPVDPKSPSWPLPNVWLGVSTEDQERADLRIPDLLATPAAVRFISAEPLLEPIRLHTLDAGPGREHGRHYVDALTGRNADVTGATVPLGSGASDARHTEREPLPHLDWVITGGESGTGARPMHADWARGLRDQCQAAGVPFFFKQWGSCLPCSWDGEDERGNLGCYLIDEEHSSIDYDDLGRAQRIEAHGAEFARFSHKNTGRKLDGREWNEMPSGFAAAGKTGVAHGVRLAD